MKYIQTGVTCIMLILTASLISCSPDTIEEYEEEEQITEEPEPEPEPDWADGVMTITVGRFETKDEIVEELKRKKFVLGGWTIKDIYNENFTITPPERQYTTDIAVVGMREAGITEPATIAEIRKKYREAGYKPLTPEEIIELRLQLENQPHTNTGHRMSSFFSLPTKKFTLISEGIPYVHILYHATIQGRGAVKGIWQTTCYTDGSRLFRPSSKDPFGWEAGKWPGDNREPITTNPETYFACAIQNTKRTK
ncbi:MAG: hypothetical protein OXL96_14245 [Candidatus Poribacteria bacterium]|nr:hypothetical protein [Candidatus Poribacteria bacterium]